MATVSPRVASATEGAAPKRPAKLLGFSRSPKTAKAETTIPPVRNRSRISFNNAGLLPGVPIANGPPQALSLCGSRPGGHHVHSRYQRKSKKAVHRKE